jgi:hypothetical protein
MPTLCFALMERVHNVVPSALHPCSNASRPIHAEPRPSRGIKPQNPLEPPPLLSFAPSPHLLSSKSSPHPTLLSLSPCRELARSPESEEKENIVIASRLPLALFSASPCSSYSPPSHTPLCFDQIEPEPSPSPITVGNIYAGLDIDTSTPTSACTPPHAGPLPEVLRR